MFPFAGKRIFDRSRITFLQVLFFLYLVVEDHDTLFIVSEIVHFIGIGVLAYKLLRKRNCGGELLSPIIPSHKWLKITASASKFVMDLTEYISISLQVCPSTLRSLLQLSSSSVSSAVL
jgi:hypothetical protein